MLANALAGLGDNDFADKSLSNLTSFGKDVIATLSSPGQNFKQLSVPAVSTYNGVRRTDYITSPGNGWIVVNYSIPAINDGRMFTVYMWDDNWLGVGQYFYMSQNYSASSTIMLPVSKNGKWSWHSPFGNITSIYFTEKR